MQFTEKKNIEEHCKRLITVSDSLNSISDTFRKQIEKIDEQLKKLNIGIPVWAEVYKGLSLGYVRIGNVWGLSITVDPCVAGYPCLFNDAPRQQRIKAILKLNDLLLAMDKEAQELIIKTYDAVAVVDQILRGK